VPTANKNKPNRTISYLPELVVEVRVPRRPSAVEGNRELLVVLERLLPHPKAGEHCRSARKGEKGDGHKRWEVCMWAMEARVLELEGRRGADATQGIAARAAQAMKWELTCCC